MPPEEVARLGENKITSGMTVEAFVQTGDRAMMPYLMKPLSDQFMRSFPREVSYVVVPALSRTHNHRVWLLNRSHRTASLNLRCGIVGVLADRDAWHIAASSAIIDAVCMGPRSNCIRWGSYQEERDAKHKSLAMAIGPYKPGKVLSATLPRSSGFNSVPGATGGIARLACARLDDGKDPTVILSKVGLTPEAARDPAVRLEVPTQIKLLELSAEEVKEEWLGFHLARSFDLSEIGLSTM